MRAVLAGALLVAVAMGGCGGDDGETPSSPVETSELTITLDRDGQGGEPAEKAELSCPGANAPRDACAAIAELPPNAADPLSPATPCTEIYGGPDLVEIDGTIKGEDVNTGLTRANGCEIERFDRFTPLLETLFPDYQPGEAIAP